MRRISSFLLVTLGTGAAAIAGPYTEAGIAGSDPSLVAFATGVTNLTRGPQSLANPTGPAASFGVAANAVGGSNGTLVSLGDAGSITLSFARPIANGDGADLAVFENGFASGSGVYAELAYVEVSTDGSTFARFPSVSLTQTTTQVGSFGTIDPTDVYNLAGKHVAGTGTPFDLSSLTNVPATVDVSHINFVRIVDVVGSIDPSFARLDSLGNAINDPFPTAFASGGFDLDAVGVFHQAVPEPTTLATLALAGVVLRRRR